MVLTGKIEVEAEAEDIQDKTMDISIIHQEVHVNIVRDSMKTGPISYTNYNRPDKDCVI